MKRIVSTCLLTAAIISFSSCGMNVLKGEGPKTSEARTVGAFDALDVSTSVDLDVTVNEGTTQSVEIKGYANIAKHIKTEVKGGTLHIEYDLDDTWNVDNDDMRIVITVPSLKALSLTGAPDAEIHGNVAGSAFKLDLSGAGEVIIDNINVTDFSADLSGAAQLEIKAGNVKTASYDLSGAGDIKAYGLQTEETTASISGAGNGKVSASKKLDASVSGAGSITYKGNPEVSQHVSGVGSVSSADGKEEKDDN